MLHITVLILLFESFFYQTYSEIDEQSLSSLAQLPLDKLLHVKQALGESSIAAQIINRDDSEDDFQVVEENTNSELGSDALPLKETPFRHKKHPDQDSPPIRRTEWDEHKKKKKKGDLSKIFQSTIIILSFLAFGGYLLCVIMTAMNNMGLGTITPTPAAAIKFPGRRRRRKRSNAKEQKVLDDLIITLHNIAEGYVKYSSGRTE